MCVLYHIAVMSSFIGLFLLNGSAQSHTFCGGGCDEQKFSNVRKFLEFHCYNVSFLSDILQVQLDNAASRAFISGRCFHDSLHGCNHLCTTRFLDHRGKLSFFYFPRKTVFSYQYVFRLQLLYYSRFLTQIMFETLIDIDK